MATKAKVKKGNANWQDKYKTLVETRYEMANRTLDNQDGLTREAIERIRDRLVLSSTGLVQVGGKIEKIEPTLIHMDYLFVACEIVADLALNGMRVANFKFDPAHCIECGETIYGVKNIKKKRR